MKQFICDICGISVGEYKLQSLYSEYQTTEIKEVCEDCSEKISSAISKVESALKPIRQSWIKQILLKLKNKATG